MVEVAGVETAAPAMLVSSQILKVVARQLLVEIKLAPDFGI